MIEESPGECVNTQTASVRNIVIKKVPGECVNTQTASMRNIVTEKAQPEEILKPKTEGFKFKKRGKLRKDEVLELARRNQSIDSWLKNAKPDIETRECQNDMNEGLGKDEASSTDLESVVVVVSHCEDPPHHGGVLTPLHSLTTITEKGVEPSCVVGWHSTVDKQSTNIENTAHTPLPGPTTKFMVGTAHTPVPGARSVEHTDGVQCCTTIQWQERAADMRKVNSISGSPGVGENSPMIGGRGEAFDTDTAKMIRIWENLENDESEWKVEGGLRRGGRRVSRRISELLEKFEGEEALKSGGGGGGGGGGGTLKLVKIPALPVKCYQKIYE